MRALKPGATAGFGCPVEMFIHHVEVTIPEGRGGEVLFEEDWGVAPAGGPDRLLRCALPRARWNAVASLAKEVLNERLKEQELPSSRWVTGINRVERLLGKEVVVLAWAVEAAEDEDVSAIASAWAALRPEERWWLFGRVASIAGSDADAFAKPRRGLALLLSGGPSRHPALAPRTPRPLKPEGGQMTLGLLDRQPED
jgi:Protein of unknown function (DUF3780)